MHVIRNSQVSELRPGEDARTYCNGEKWIIIFNDKNDSSTSRFAIAHELGHILLGHEKTQVKYSKMEQFVKKPKSENQADMFALRLLCPACVLWGIQTSSVDDIESTCRVPRKWAEIRSSRMKALYKRNAFLSNSCEERVYNNFSKYISLTNERKDTPWHSSRKE